MIDGTHTTRASRSAVLYRSVRCVVALARRIEVPVVAFRLPVCFLGVVFPVQTWAWGRGFCRLGGKVTNCLYCTVLTVLIDQDRPSEAAPIHPRSLSTDVSNQHTHTRQIHPRANTLPIRTHPQTQTRQPAKTTPTPARGAGEYTHAAQCRCSHKRAYHDTAPPPPVKPPTGLNLFAPSFPIPISVFPFPNPRSPSTSVIPTPLPAYPGLSCLDRQRQTGRQAEGRVTQRGGKHPKEALAAAAADFRHR